MLRLKRTIVNKSRGLHAKLAIPGIQSRTSSTSNQYSAQPHVNNSNIYCVEKF